MTDNLNHFDRDTRELIFDVMHKHAQRRTQRYAQFKKLALRNGYVASRGGWIWNTTLSGRPTDTPVCQGMAELAEKIWTSAVPFKTDAQIDAHEAALKRIHAAVRTEHPTASASAVAAEVLVRINEREAWLAAWAGDGVPVDYDPNTGQVETVNADGERSWHTVDRPDRLYVGQHRAPTTARDTVWGRVG